MDNELIVKKVDFNGSNIAVAQDKETGKIYAGVKWICRGIGLTEDQMKNERKKIQSDLVLSKGVSNLTLPTKGGKQEVLCIELDFLPLWLAKISITPTMQREQPDVTENLINYQLKAKDVLADAFIKKNKNKEPSKKKNLSSVNMTAKILKETLKDAGCDKKYIAVAVSNLYKNEADIDFGVPLIADVPKLYDCTGMAKELGVMSESGNPHDKAISAIIQKISVSEDEIIKTPYENNGHSGVTVQYKESVFYRVKDWLHINNYPSHILYEFFNGKTVTCKVFYKNLEVAHE